ncbi:hypothetical protein A2881_00170 [Candidatus Peribacteria bacterium RIFCSPHIGHO2_01_FULL_55_13]|nr:MAG: hypothetical protein A2881_00170 [Candidatus Peribacteria bacterium RIFCSPHIGHO2_01_FULL_55_13]OGJ65271.1 MAG: hypothetical protein A3F36_00320 [Candidatus Peribacteria bacterium RIFCSPHIGHO2_12_FULL_55_11]OGJ71095.1 MAG: hypothetical protein A3G69_00015 [Candidatus Peribacteria bacterium RIFCSPLOWO2_12_FULL_53_10]
MNIVLGLLGMAAGIAIIKFREPIGDLFGEAAWTRYVGGPYNMAIIVGILLFFFSLAKMTGTTGFFLSPLKMVVPGG